MLERLLHGWWGKLLVLVLLGFANSIPMLMAAWLVLGVGMGYGLYDAAFGVLGRIYGEAARGPITGITLIAGFASTVGWPLTALGVAVLGMRSVFILGALVLGGLVPLGVIAYKARRRVAAFERLLPDLLMSLAASLKAGHSFKQGLQAVVDEGMEPAANELKRVLTETRLGRPMEDALEEMADRISSKNLKFIVTAVNIQNQVGGSLAGLFDMVADTVRDRQQFARKTCARPWTV